MVIEFPDGWIFFMSEKRRIEFESKANEKHYWRKRMGRKEASHGWLDVYEDLIKRVDELMKEYRHAIYLEGRGYVYREQYLGYSWERVLVKSWVEYRKIIADDARYFLKRSHESLVLSRKGKE
jgi:hypothetical protein